MADPSADAHGGQQVWLDADDYGHLRRATETYREELLVRLGGEVGLRTAEMARVRPGDLRRYRGDHYFLGVRDAEGTKTRDAYLPADIADAVRKHARSNDVRADERLVEVSPRRIQMLVARVAERAADRTGDPRLAGVTSGDLRRYFARQLLVEARIDPAVVMAVGGWSGFESLQPYLREPDDGTVVAEFERASRLGTVPDEPDARRLGDALEAAGHAVYVVDADGHFEYVNDAFQSATGHAAGEVIGRSPGRLLSGTSSGSYAEIWRAVGRGDVWEGGLDFRHAEGGSVRLAATVAPLTREGALAGYVAVGRPVEKTAGDDGEVATPEHVREVVEGYSALGRALTECSTREGVATVACERVTGIESYVTAWVAERGPDDDLTVEACAGSEEELLRGIVDDPAAGDLVRDSIRTREPRFERVGTLPEAWRDGGGETVGCVPIVGDRPEGALVVHAADAVSEWERRLLSDLGYRLGQVVAAIERRKLLVADTVLELEFAVADERALLVGLARECGCSFRLDGMVPVAGGSMLYFLRTSGAAPERILDAAMSTGGIADARLVQDYEDDSLLELVVTGNSPAVTIVEHGGRVAGLTVDERATIVAEFSRDTDPRAVVERLSRDFPDSSLQAKREREESIQTTEGFRQRLDDRLTDKQQQALQAAYFAGYFEWPRGSTAEELADSMGVSSPTLHNHLRKAQGKLLTAFFDEQRDRR